MSNNRVLIISYLFPPAGGVAVQRALSLAKYLPGCGFDVHVLRASNASAPVRDPGLLEHLPPGVTVHRALTLEPPFALRQRIWSWLSRPKRAAIAPAGARSRPNRWKSAVTGAVRRILCPEPEVLWVPLALRKARRIVRQHGIGTVLVTAPPFSAFLIGNALKREFPGIRLVSDFRDSWLGFYQKTFDYQNSDYTRRRSAAIERSTVELSDAVVTVTRSIREELCGRYSDQPREKFLFVPNGYDPEVFSPLAWRAPAQNKIVVTHMGTVYAASSPRYFLDALEAMPETIRSAFEVRFLGRIADEEQATFSGRVANVRLQGFMPQSEAKQQFEETDYALLVMTDAASLTGKVFEYLATGKPILAVAPADGEIAELLRETGAGWCVDPGDRAGLESMIRAAYERARDHANGFKPNWPAIRRYERPKLVAEFGNILRTPEGKQAVVEVRG